MCVLFSPKNVKSRICCGGVRFLERSVFKLDTCSQDLIFKILMVWTVIAGNVKRKVRGKKPSCRKGCRTWNKTSFRYNRIPQIGRRPPVSQGYPAKQLTHRARGFCPSMLHRSSQGETAEVHLKLVMTKGPQRRAACQQSLRVKVIRSGKVCDLFKSCCLSALSTWEYFIYSTHFVLLWFHILSSLEQFVQQGRVRYRFFYSGWSSEKHQYSILQCL